MGPPPARPPPVKYQGVPETRGRRPPYKGRRQPHQQAELAPGASEAQQGAEHTHLSATTPASRSGAVLSTGEPEVNGMVGAAAWLSAASARTYSH